ncbi:MAG TPA: response regulator [Gemmatimonadaceae bacterium]|jgi:two-component system LytT family response regulator
MTRVLIVDDEALARERIRTLLASERDVTIVGECSGGREAVAAIVQHRPDLVFLDIQMPDLDGFQVLEAVAMDWLPAVVFVTAYDEYAIQAFDVNAMDYILKPIEPARFQKALGRAVKRGPLDRFVIRAGGKVLFVKPGDIDWIEADGKLAQVHVGRETHAVRIPLKRLEERLEAHGFVRVHRSAIVNVDRIRELEPWFHGEYVVILKDGTKLTSSAAHSQALHRIVDTAE